jgi:hypothetical protein
MSYTVPLSTYDYSWGWGLVAPRSVSGVEIAKYYEFYEFVDKDNGKIYNNILDWDNKMNLLSPNLSSYTDWSKKDGIVQNILSYELTKGFKLFTSAADIQYNN